MSGDERTGRSSDDAAETGALDESGDTGESGAGAGEQSAESGDLDDE